MRQDEVLDRLCSLRGLVRLLKQGPADCICGETDHDPNGFQDDGKTLEFIERATLHAWAKEKGWTYQQARARLLAYRGEPYDDIIPED